MEMDLNWIAVAVAFLAYWISGALWYSPLILGKKFMSLMKFTEKDMKEAKEKGMAKEYISSMIAALFSVLALAVIMNNLDIKSYDEGLMFVALIWLGFVVTSNSSAVIWEKRKCGLFNIQMSWSAVAMVIAYSILFFWK